MNKLVALPTYQRMTIRNWNTTTKLLALMNHAGLIGEGRPIRWSAALPDPRYAGWNQLASARRATSVPMSTATRSAVRKCRPDQTRASIASCSSSAFDV